MTTSARGSVSTSQPGDRRGELELSRERTAPRAARTWLGQQFGAGLSADQLATAKLLISEIVTNAVVHGQGEIVLRARLASGRLFAEVTDGGPGFTWRVPKPEDVFGSGWGLMLVAGESDRWGVREGTSNVWFELDA